MAKEHSPQRRIFLKQSGIGLAASTCISPSLLFLSSCSGTSSEKEQISHLVVAGEEGRYLGWPANNGLWTWDNGKEILVGYTEGRFVDEDEMHNIAEPYISKLARSTDGGKTWKSEKPDSFMKDGTEPVPSPGNIDFGHAGFALRVVTTGYHGSEDPKGHFYFSYDRGKSWQGPFQFNGLNEDPRLEGLEITARTDYLINGENSILIMMAARNPELEFGSRRDKPFVAETTDGGKTFQFVSWVVPWSDDYRAVMPSTVRLSEKNLVVATRRRNPFDTDQPCWIDAYHSQDNGKTWSFLSKVTETGIHNGNPPALTSLSDGRLVCCYANRITTQVLVRYSEDEGKTWGGEIVIRDNPLGYDLGYPQITQNPEGELVAIYYLATEERPHSYIEAAIWQP